MKILIKKLIAMGRTLLFICLFTSAIAFNQSLVLADTARSNSVDTAKQAAKEVVKNTGVKKQFGKSENGNELLDNAQNKASQKLNKLADRADSSDELPGSKKLFLDNLTDTK